MDTLAVFQLSQEIEHGFSKFGYSLPFGRDLISSNPTEAIESGLLHLSAIGAISDEERSEHIGNYQWGEQSLYEVASSSDGLEQLNVLMRNLDYWYQRYVERYVEDNEKNAEVQE